MNKAFLFSLTFAVLVWAVWGYFTYPDSLNLIEKNWPISLTMVFGSFIAGATSEGGGAVAFPVFTKLLHISPVDARVFSLAIQSVGMIAATFTIIILRVAVAWSVVLWATIGGVFGIIIGALWIAPLLAPELIKMLFTAMIVSFAITLALLNWKQRLYNDHLLMLGWREKWIFVFAGFSGGVMSGLVGNGIDIICFSLMVLLFRLTEKVATPTSVVLMALNSVVGFTLHLFVTGDFTLQVEQYWLAAVPVVVLGAPLGTYCCTRLNNKTIAVVLIVLIVIELISSLILIPLTSEIIFISLLVFTIFSIIYYQMFRATYYHSKIEES